MKPFADNAAQVSIGDLTVDNGVEAVLLQGKLEVTKDKSGLELILALKAQVDAIAEALQAGTLPDRVASPPLSTTVPNPFESPT